jgi:hypothetical protein
MVQEFKRGEGLRLANYLVTPRHSSTTGKKPPDPPAILPLGISFWGRNRNAFLEQACILGESMG